MKFLRRNRRDNQRGATLTGYALVVASMAAGSLGAINTLEDNSSEFLGNTGQVIGTARDSSGDLRNVQFATPDGWTPPTEATSSTTPSTVPSTGPSTVPSTTPTTAPTTAAPTTAAPTTAAPTTTPVPVAYQSVPVGVAAGGCIWMDGNGWLSREDNCSDNESQITSTHLANGNVVLSTIDGQCFQPWNGNDTWVDALDCNGQDNQEWWAIPVGDSFMYQNVNSGECLDFTRDSNDTQWAVLRSCDTSDSGQLLNLE